MLTKCGVISKEPKIEKRSPQTVQFLSIFDKRKNISLVFIILLTQLPYTSKWPGNGKTFQSGRVEST